MSMTISLDPQTLSLVEDLAKRTSSTKAKVIIDAVTAYDEYDRWFRTQVENDLKALEEGKVIPHEVVVQEIEDFLKSIRKEKLNHAD